MQKIGCLGWFAIIFLVGSFIAAFQNDGFDIAVGWPALVAIVGIVVLVLVLTKRNNKDHSAGLLAVANMLDAWAVSNTDASGKPLTEAGEQELFELSAVELLEFKSSGSTYSGGTAGVSFPLFGRVRGNVGGNRGQISRNPEVLVNSDVGRLKVSSERLIFVGDRETREIELDKLLDVELGPNGLWAKLALSNRQKREGFQHMQLDQIPIGMAIGIANEWASGGKTGALAYTRNLSKDIRETLAATKKR